MIILTNWKVSDALKLLVLIPIVVAIFVLMQVLDYDNAFFRAFCTCF